MLLLYLIALYLSAGLVFSILFLTLWINMVDESSEGTSWSFRLLILPGCVVFWPLLLKKYLKARRGI